MSALIYLRETGAGLRLERARLLSPSPILFRHLLINVHETLVDLDGTTGQPEGFRVRNISDAPIAHEFPDPVQAFNVKIIEARG